MNTKTCIGCRTAKPLEEFYRVHRGAERRQPRCKVCDNRKRAGTLKGGRSEVAVDAVRREDGSIELVRRVRKA